MSPVFRDDGLAVLDRVLPEADFANLTHEIARGEYKSVHAQKWDRAWRLWDGHPLRGQSVYFDPGRRFGWKGATYPTSTSVDRLIDAVRRTAASCQDIVGVEGIDWVALYLSPWLYPVGSALAIHRDGQAYSGSFTFFVHSRWSSHWGGELLVSSATGASTIVAGEESWLSDEGDDDNGLATCVSPRPNRLALIGPNRPHRVARVDANAGSRVRASVAGFFLRPPRA
jgi:hypothetical protein